MTASLIIAIKVILYASIILAIFKQNVLYILYDQIVFQYY